MVVVAALAAASPAAAGFVAGSSPVTRADVRHSWRPGCPVAPSQLRLLRLTFRGFDGRDHTGGLVVAARVAPAVTRVFARLYRAGVPLRRMQPIDAFGGSDRASMAADNTSGFNCRPAVAAGPRRWSSHAYGTAIDVNPRENPYVEGGRVLPAAGARYLDRSSARPGMALPDGPIVRAFATAGWQWGGRWRGTPDYQHFSAGGG